MRRLCARVAASIPWLNSIVVPTPVNCFTGDEGWKAEILWQIGIADAVLDRMVHNSYRIDMKGDSRRKQIAKEKKKKMEELQGGKK